MRPVLLSFLAGLTLVTALAAGVVRGRVGPSDRFVICTGQGPVMVVLDENGAPLGPPMLCPDGIMLLFGAVAVPTPPAPLFAGEVVLLAPLPERTDRIFAFRTRAMARAPPRPA